MKRLLRGLFTTLAASLLFVACNLPATMHLNNPYDPKAGNYIPPETPPDISMVFIPGGTFNMGNSGYNVTLNSFWIGKYELTQALYASVMQTNPSSHVDANAPVEKVSWFDAVQFCNFLSGMSGLEPVYSINGSIVSFDQSKNGYRLPTEAEWEYAARAGGTTTYAGSNTIDDVAWYSGNSSSITHPVGQKIPNQFGIYDMSGNVSEWCWDWYASTLPSGSATNPTGPATGTERTERSGAWDIDQTWSEVLKRDKDVPTSTFADVGFRLARNN